MMEKQVKKGFGVSKERETFSLGGLKNFFSDTPPQEKLEVQTIPRSEHSALKDVLHMEGMSQDIKEQNIEFVMSSKDSLIRNQMSIAISRLNAYGKYFDL